MYGMQCPKCKKQLVIGLPIEEKDRITQHKKTCSKKTG